MNVGTVEIDTAEVDIVDTASQRYGPWLWNGWEDKGKREGKERRANHMVRGHRIWRS
jgi:hypothetical protein